MNQRGINRCVACGTQDDWNFGGGEVFVPPETSEEGMSERFQPSVPRGLKVAFPCGTCGYVMLFDAATVGDYQVLGREGQAKELSGSSSSRMVAEAVVDSSPEQQPETPSNARSGDLA